MARLPRGLRPFGHRAFRLFWFGQAISLTGTWMQTVAQGWLVLQLASDAPLALGMLGVAQFAPVLVLGLLGGVAADAIPKRAALIATQVAALVLALVLALLVLSGHVEIWHVLLLALLMGVVNAFDMPIRQSFVVEMVGREDVASAVALNSALFNGTRVIGPAVAGLLIASIGMAACFLLNAASYGAVIVGLLLIREKDLVPVARRHLDPGLRPVLADLAEGLRYVRGTPTTLLVIGVVGVVSVSALNMGVVLPLVTRDLLAGGPETFGFLAAATGAGSLVSAMSMAVSGRVSIGRLMLGAAIIGLATMGLAFSSWLALSLALLFLVGWGLIAMAATTNTILQLATPDRLRGRVMSVYTTVFAGSTPIGSLLTGVLAGIGGISLALLVGGAAVLVTAGLAFAVWSTGGDRFGVTPPSPSASPEPR